MRKAFKNRKKTLQTLYVFGGRHLRIRDICMEFGRPLTGHFSNLLIIHQEKTKKITTVTVVWICVPNYHKILPTFSLNFSKNY